MNNPPKSYKELSEVISHKNEGVHWMPVYKNNVRTGWFLAYGMHHERISINIPRSVYLYHRKDWEKFCDVWLNMTQEEMDKEEVMCVLCKNKTGELC